MEFNDRNKIFFAGIDNDSRYTALDRVEEIETIQELFDYAYNNFNENTLSFNADQILDYFNEDYISPNLKRTEGFNPQVFKSLVLFELTHVDEEDIIPAAVEKLSRFWTDIDDDKLLAQIFTSEIKRHHPRPLANYSEQITRVIVLASYDRKIANRPIVSEPTDSLEAEIDEKPWTIRLGDKEIISEDSHPVLTNRLMMDLGKLFPSSIVSELEFLFPDDGKFEDIQPLIDKITFELINGIYPSIEDIVTGYKKFLSKNETMFNQKSEDEELSEEELKEIAHRYYTYRYRSRPTTIPSEHYIPETEKWYIVQRMRPVHLEGIEYRRIFSGDFTSTDIVELEPTEHSLVTDHLESINNKSIQDIRYVYGSFDPYMLVWQAALPKE